MRTRTLSILLLVALVASPFYAASSSAAPARASTEPTHAHVPGELLVGFSEGAGPQTRARVHREQRSMVIKRFEEIGVDLVRIPPGSTVAAAAASYRARKEVELASPNYLRRAYGVTPNDPEFGDQWGLRNTGQIVDGDTGTSDADIDASEASLQDAWQVTTGSSVPVVGVIDTGIEVAHPDLAANIWTNTGEIPANGIDDDGNGYIDDVNGWDFFDDNNTVFDSGQTCSPSQGGGLNDDHGTHVAGIIGAVGNNSIGVAGVNWNVRIMPLKFLGKRQGVCGVGTDADAIEAILYATRMGAQFINNSWGGAANDPALRQAFIAAGRGGVLAPVAAGNSNTNLATTPEYPASFGLENEIVVAASNNDDGLAGFSSFGGPTALAAPGVNVLSTVSQAEGSYDFFSGTSMATPFVTGALALLRSQYPEAPSLELKDRLLDKVDLKTAFGGGKTATGGRLNIDKAIRDTGPAVIPTVLVPNGGEVLNAGATSNVEWNTNVPSGNPTLPYRVEYTTNANAATSSSSNFEGAMPTGITQPDDSDAPWSLSGTSFHAGVFSAGSGAVANEEGSWMTLTRIFSSAGTISFWYRVSSEDCTDGNTPVCGDYLRFYIDGYPVLEENGETGWQASPAFNVAPGTHELSWAYQKDQLCPGPESTCSGLPPSEDAAWIDDLSITGLDASSWTLAGTTSTGATDLAWSVPGTETNSAKVRVCRNLGLPCLPGDSDESDSLFSIHIPVPGVTLAQSAGTTSVTEGGAGDSYTVVLNTQPSSNVTISIDDGSQLTANPTSLTFTSSNWSTPQTVNVSAVNDSIDETSPHNGTLTHSATSADSAYNGISIPSITAAITDNDSAGVTVSQSGGSTNVTEGGAGDSYTVVLTSQPTSNVTININSGSQLTTSPTSLNFTSSNWSTPQTVNVSAVNDSTPEGLHSANIFHSASSSDSNYNGISVASITVNITDNDQAVVINQSGGSTGVSEAGAGDSYTVALTTQPASTVTISINAGSQLSTNPTSLVFTSSNWSTPQTVNVSAVNDSIDETSPHNATLTHSATSSDSAYNGISIPSIIVAITDNDTAGVTISQSGGSTNVTEGGAGDNYTVVLASQPASNVTININSGSQLTTSPTSLNFTSSNWSTPQTLNVSAVNDSASEGLHNGTITHSASSSDGSYNGISIPSVVASITDNDSPGVAVTQSGGSTSAIEGGTGDSYTVALTTQPSSNVTISINAGSQLSTNPTSLTFTSSDWSTPQTVNVSAVNDSTSEGLHSATISHIASSSDGSYNAIGIPSVGVSITDNDPGVFITQTGGSTTASESGGSDSYSVVLSSAPTSNVVISINSGSQLSVNPTSLTFTAVNWSTPQTVDVFAIDDSTDESSPHTGTVQHSASSSDVSYSGISIANVSVAITDNDAAAILISQSEGSTGVVEGGTTDSYTVVLQSAPSSDVTVFVSGGPQLSVSPLSIVFTTANWSSPRTVNVAAVNDSAVEGSHSGTITHSASSSDSAYNGISIPAVTVSITDNDLGTWESLGGGLAPETGPAVSSWGDDRTDVFVKGNDAALWHRFWNGSVWSGWVSLGGVLTSDPAAVSWGPGRIDVFVRGTDGQTWHMHFNGSSWSGWEPLGGFITSAPAVSSWDPNRLDVFARGGDNQLWHMSWNATAWSGWEPLGGGLASDPAAVSWSSNRIDAFVKGTDGQLWHMSWNGGSWSGWEPLGGFLTSSPTTSSTNVNLLDVFARGGDNQLWHRSWNGGSWTAWQSAGAPSTSLGTFVTSAPDATALPGNQSELFVRGADGALWRRFWSGPMG